MMNSMNKEIKNTGNIKEIIMMTSITNMINMSQIDKLSLIQMNLINQKGINQGHSMTKKKEMNEFISIQAKMLRD